MVIARLERQGRLWGNARHCRWMDWQQSCLVGGWCFDCTASVKSKHFDWINGTLLQALAGEARCTYCGVQIWLTDLRVINRVVFAARVGNGFASASAMAGISALQFLLFEAKHDMASQRPVLKKLAFPKVGLPKCSTRWWFQIFFIFTPIWGRFPLWLIFFKGVEITN